jgi:hypothetical protein
LQVYVPHWNLAEIYRVLVNFPLKNGCVKPTERNSWSGLNVRDTCEGTTSHSEMLRARENGTAISRLDIVGHAEMWTKALTIRFQDPPGLSGKRTQTPGGAVTCSRWLKPNALQRTKV